MPRSRIVPTTTARHATATQNAPTTIDFFFHDADDENASPFFEINRESSPRLEQRPCRVRIKDACVIFSVDTSKEKRCYSVEKNMKKP